MPQIKPKIPATETDSGEDRNTVLTTDRAIITNDNNGVWFIEEKIKDENKTPPSKREFSETTVNPALTEKPRTWPSMLKTNIPRENDIYNDVTIVEKSRQGQIGQSINDARNGAESTTFSTSRVEMSVSTTPRPVSDRKHLDDGGQQGDKSALRNLMLQKAHKLLDSLAHKERNLEKDLMLQKQSGSSG